MRTTLTLDDDVFELAARQAKLRGVSLSRAVSDLLRRRLNAPTPTRQEGGIVVFDLPADSPTVTTEKVRTLANSPWDDLLGNVSAEGPPATNPNVRKAMRSNPG